MPARLPLLHKTPCALDPAPRRERGSPHAGLLATACAFRALKLPDLIAANLPLKARQRGFSEAQFLESLVLLQTVGGDHPEDIALFAGDECLQRGLGYAPPQATAARSSSSITGRSR